MGLKLADNNYIIWISTLFEELEKCTDIGQVDTLLEEFKIDKRYYLNTKAYPQLQFNISKEEIESFVTKNILNETFAIDDDGKKMDTATKLLYAILWKQGDLKKISHILKGIMDLEHAEKHGAVFHQFGKHLRTKEEPIVDQHVLRAFGIYLNSGNENEAFRIRKMAQLESRDKGLIEDYKQWLNNKLNQRLRRQVNYRYHVDKLLFAVGKSVKSK